MRPETSGEARTAERSATTERRDTFGEVMEASTPDPRPPATPIVRGSFLFVGQGKLQVALDGKTAVSGGRGDGVHPRWDDDRLAGRRSLQRFDYARAELAHNSSFREEMSLESRRVDEFHEPQRGCVVL